MATLKKQFTTYPVFFICLFLIVVFSTCEEEEDSNDNPIANFAYKFQANKVDSSSPIKFPTYYNIFTINNSKNANQFDWNLGDGRVLAQKEPVFAYKISGTYDIILTAINDQENDSQTKKVIIKDRLLKSIIVKSLNWNTSFNTSLNWEKTKKADLFIRMYKANNGVMPQLIGELYDAPVYFQSASITSVGIDDVPIQISVDKPVVIEHPDSEDIYGYCLYAREFGKEILIFSNWGSGTVVLFNEEYSSKLSTLTVGFNGSQISFNAEF